MPKKLFTQKPSSSSFYIFSKGNGAKEPTLGKPQKKKPLGLLRRLLYNRKLNERPSKTPEVVSKILNNGYNLKGLHARTEWGLNENRGIRLKMDIFGNLNDAYMERKKIPSKPIGIFQKLRIRSLLKNNPSKAEEKINKLYNKGYSLEGLGLYSVSDGMPGNTGLLVNKEGTTIHIACPLENGIKQSFANISLNSNIKLRKEDVRYYLAYEIFNPLSRAEIFLKDLANSKVKSVAKKARECLSNPKVQLTKTELSTLSGELHTEISKTVNTIECISKMQGIIYSTLQSPNQEIEQVLRMNEEYLSVMREQWLLVSESKIPSLSQLTTLNKLLTDIVKIKVLQIKTLINAISKYSNPTFISSDSTYRFKLDRAFLPNLQYTSSSLCLPTDLYISEYDSTFNRELGFIMPIVQSLIMMGKEGVKVFSKDELAVVIPCIEKAIKRIKEKLAQSTDAIQGVTILLRENTKCSITSYQVLQEILDKYQSFISEAKAHNSHMSINKLFQEKLTCLVNNGYKNMVEDFARIDIEAIKQQEEDAVKKMLEMSPSSSSILEKEALFTSLLPENLESAMEYFETKDVFRKHISSAIQKTLILPESELAKESLYAHMESILKEPLKKSKVMCRAMLLIMDSTQLAGLLRKMQPAHLKKICSILEPSYKSLLLSHLLQADVQLANLIIFHYCTKEDINAFVNETILTGTIPEIQKALFSLEGKILESMISKMNIETLRTILTTCPTSPSKTVISQITLGISSISTQYIIRAR